jgi:hypothetical protein
MKHNQNGSINVLLIPLIVAVLILVTAIIFGSWAYSSRSTYKNNSSQLIAAAVTNAKAQESTQLNAAFALQEQKPLDTYTGPEAYGSLVVKYPKNWSAYVDDTGDSSANVDGYFYPGVIPALTATSSVFALRIEVIDASYSDTVSAFQSSEVSGKDTVTAYQLPLVPSVIGAEVTGQLSGGITGTMVILPIRSETLEVWTESSQYLSEFNDTILPNLSFSP